MRRGRTLVWKAAALAVAIFLAGCVTVSERNAYTIDELVASSIAGNPDLRFFPQRRPDLQYALGWSGAETMRPPEPQGERFDILALSSGGPDGAFGAGALKGMSARGERQEYEIVTGVSTGALMAPFVFTGAHNDALLERMYTSGRMGNLLGPPNVLAALSGPSLYSDAAIGKFMDEVYTAAIMRAVAVEHQKGRRLLVATANLDANQLVVWNMGRIAMIGTPAALQLFRDVLRAAIAIPGALPPVEIASQYGDATVRELHGDAGVLAYFYAEPGLFPPSARGKDQKRNATPAPRIDLILHNQIEAPPKPVEAKTLKLAGASVSNLTRTSMRLLLDRTIGDAADAGVAMRYAFLPTEWRTVSSLEFDQPYMRRTFDLGYRQAVEGTLWHEGPR